jgi:hypothetical protein
MAATAHVFPGAILHETPYYGYPTVSAPRRVKPTILGVIHTTETYSVPMPSSTHSWTFSVERDGTVHQFMDPVTASPWTNGDVKSPDLSNPIVAAAAKSTYNFNEWCFLTIENVNRIADGQRLTDAQLLADRRILAWGSQLSGLPMDRLHVIGHYQVNAETRVNCPTVPTDRQRVFDGVLGLLPNTSVSEDEMPAWVNAIKPVNPPYRAIIGPDTNIRLSPSLADDQVAWNTKDAAESPIIVAGHVAGEEYAGSTDWLVYALDNGGLRCVHSSQPIRKESLGIDQSQLDAANDRIQVLANALTIANGRLSVIDKNAIPVPVPK